MDNVTVCLTEKKLKNRDLKYYLHSLVVVFFMFGFGHIPPIEPMTAFGMQVLGIFLGLLYAWTTVDLIWPSLLGLVALGLTGHITIKAAFMEGFGDDIALLMIFLFVFAQYLDDAGLCKVIANWFISRKFAIGRPWVLSFMILMASYVIGAVIGIFASMVLMWAIFYEICETVGYKKGEKYPILMVVGIVYVGMLGTVIFPYRPIAAIILRTINEYTGLTVNFLAFTGVNVFVSLLCAVGYVLLCKYVFKPDMHLLKGNADFFGHLRGKKMNFDEKLAGLFLIVFMLAMFLPSFLPATWGIVKFLKQFTMTGVLATTVMILAFLQFNGKRVLNFGAVASKGLSWETFVLMAGTMPIASALGSKESGVMDFITVVITPLLSSVSPLMVTILIIVLASLLTQIAHNLVLAVVLSPILCNFALQFGFDPIPVAILMAFVLNIALATPGASGMAAMLYCNKEWAPTKDAYKYTIICIGLTLLLVVGIGVPLVEWMY